ncbi:MAG: hypothetical protein J0I06_28295 [Planctomycetes bacterium]|nr:hypothetical protein [Planctomycetota bacterium]
MFKDALIHAASHRRIPLGIQVNQQHAAFRRGKTGCKIDAGGGFTDSAFLIRYRQNFRHLSHSLVLLQY